MNFINIRWALFIPVFVALFFLLGHLYIKYGLWSIHIPSSGWRLIALIPVIPFLLGATTFPWVISLFICPNGRLGNRILLVISIVLIAIHLFVYFFEENSWKNQMLIGVFYLGILYRGWILMKNGAKNEVPWGR